jgi:dimethylglycine dehydrogenase
MTWSARLWDPLDGDIDPSQPDAGLRQGARDLGCRIKRFTKVIGLQRTPTGEWCVETDQGDITCEIVANAAGYRAGEIMAMVGQYMPIVSMSHQYLVTESIRTGSAQGEVRRAARSRRQLVFAQSDGLLLGP